MCLLVREYCSSCVTAAAAVLLLQQLWYCCSTVVTVTVGVVVGVKERFKKTMVKSRLNCAGHVERVGGGKLAEMRRPDSGGTRR